MVRQDSASKDAQKEKKKMENELQILQATLAALTATVERLSASADKARAVEQTVVPSEGPPNGPDMLLTPLVSLLPPIGTDGTCMVGKQRVIPVAHDLCGTRVKARIGRHDCVAIVISGVTGLDDYVVIKRDPGEGHAVVRHVSALGAVQPSAPSAPSAPVPSVVPSVPSTVASVAAQRVQRDASIAAAKATTTVQPRRMPQGQRRESSVIGSTDPVICPVTPPDGARQFVLVSKDTGKVELLRDGTPKVFGLAQRGGQLLAGHHIAYTPEKLTAFRIDWIG